MNFTGGAPVNMAGNTWFGGDYNNQEGATTQCFPNGNVAFYSNSCHIKDATHTIRGNDPLNGGGGNSSTQGVISIPNPADPNNQFYMITAAVDPSGGSNCTQSNHGIYVYPVDATGVVTVGAPTQLYNGSAAAGRVNEAIAVSSDFNGGYWVVSADHNNGTGAVRFLAWHIDNTGTINTTPVPSAVATGVWNFQPQASIVFNKCNNRIAFVQHGPENYYVFNWDATSGTTTGSIRSGNAGVGFLYGCEFSPDGNMLYVTGLNGGDALRQINLATGANNVVAANPLATCCIQGWGNLKLGPDDRIYVSHAYSAAETGPKYLGVINNPNATTVGGANYVANGYTINGSGGNYPSTQRGLITLGWHNPNLPISTSTTPCMSFSYTYEQYFGTSIPVVPGSAQWDFGEGSGWQTGLGNNPSHSYASNGNYTVRLRVRDQACNNFYTSELDINVNCPTPVEMLDFKANCDNGTVELAWQTATETDNDYFEVQRSPDMQNFETIAVVQGSGTTNQIQSYSVQDKTPSDIKNYYRLVQYDFDGSYEISHSVATSCDLLGFSIRPNPSSSAFALTTSTDLTGSRFIVLDVLGKIVAEGVVKANTTELGKQLLPGTYVFKLNTGNQVIARKIIKQ